MVKDKRLDELLNLLKEKNQEVFAELYDIMHDEIFRYIYSIVRNKEYAQDLTHDTFIQIYKNAGHYNQKSHAKAWMITISRNITYMSLRKSNRELLVDYEIDHPDQGMKETIHDKILIEKMMTLLNNEEREIIVLHIIEGFAFREISSIMDIGLSTVLSKYHRSLKKLRNSMEV